MICEVSWRDGSFNKQRRNVRYYCFSLLFVLYLHLLYRFLALEKENEKLSGTVSTILGCVFGIVIALMGLIILIMPYDKYQEIFPRVHTKLVVKILSVLTMLFGVLIAIAMVTAA